MTETRRLGQFELLEVVARGETLSLYRAHDKERDRPVHVKLVHSHLQNDDDLVARFRQRTQDLLHLRHPHIAPVIDAGFEPDALFAVTDSLDGESLQRRLARRGPLEVDDALSVISQVAVALDYAHEQGVFHHDIRPSNIFLQGRTAVLTDFFLLEAIGATPTYVAPEQLDETSSGVPDSRSDAYALGVVVYEMLTDRLPFEGTGAEIAAAHLTQRPLSPRLHNPDLFPALDAILLKALAKQPQSRYQTAGALATALHEAVQAAQTRRMSSDDRFSDDANITNETRQALSRSYRKLGIPLWIWVGLGILVAVILASAILLATS